MLDKSPFDDSLSPSESDVIPDDVSVGEALLLCEVAVSVRSRGGVEVERPLDWPNSLDRCEPLSASEEPLAPNVGAIGLGSSARRRACDSASLVSAAARERETPSPSPSPRVLARSDPAAEVESLSASTRRVRRPGTIAPPRRWFVPGTSKPPTRIPNTPAGWSVSSGRENTSVVSVSV